MAPSPALFLGNVGATGGNSTGPHAHWEVLKGDKRFPLSQTRKDIGQFIQFRLPGQQVWQPLYSSEKEGFKLNPAAVITSQMGGRLHPTEGVFKEHKGEDYGFPQGTSLRFIGQGGVGSFPNQGTAGNVSVLNTGPYTLKTFHLDKLPGTASTEPLPAVPVLPPPPGGATGSSDLERENDILKAYIYGSKANQKEEEPKRTIQDELKEQLLGSVLSKALNPMSFLSSYNMFDPYMSGFNTGTEQYFKQVFG